MREFVHFCRKENLLGLGFQIAIAEKSTDVVCLDFDKTFH